MAYAVSSDRALEDFSGKNQDAASFCRLLCTVHGAGWLVFWNQNADIDMDQRGRAY